MCFTQCTFSVLATIGLSLFVHTHRRETSVLADGLARASQKEKKCGLSNLETSVLLALPVGTTAVKYYFSQMKPIKKSSFDLDLVILIFAVD